MIFVIIKDLDVSFSCTIFVFFGKDNTGFKNLTGATSFPLYEFIFQFKDFLFLGCQLIFHWNLKIMSLKILCKFSVSVCIYVFI